MALDSMIFSGLMTASYEKVIGFGTEWIPGTPVQFDLTYPDYFALNYDIHAKYGEVKGAIIPGIEPFSNNGGDFSILSAYFRSITFGDNVLTFAEALAEYWSTVAVVPGPPMHGGVSVVSVVNDATAQVPAFQQAILAAMGAVALTPWFDKLPRSIMEIALPQVTWTVTELIPSGSGVSPVPFPEKIV